MGARPCLSVAWNSGATPFPFLPSLATLPFLLLYTLGPMPPPLTS